MYNYPFGFFLGFFPLELWSGDSLVWFSIWATSSARLLIDWFILLRVEGGELESWVGVEVEADVGAGAGTGAWTGAGTGAGTGTGAAGTRGGTGAGAGTGAETGAWAGAGAEAAGVGAGAGVADLFLFLPLMLLLVGEILERSCWSSLPEIGFFQPFSSIPC